MQNPTTSCIPDRWQSTVAAVGSLLILANLPTAELYGQSPTPLAATPITALKSQPHQLIGSASCAASNCHGGTSSPDSGPLYAAHRIWLKYDRHATAYDVLFYARSIRMIEQLNRIPDAGGKWKSAHLEHRCLACHAHVCSADEPHGDGFEISDGVSCESCHGPAKDWIRDHSRRDVWSKLKSDEKERRGFRDLGNFAKRGEQCAKCHVGAPDREVNHDMIAAGHPRLAFELAGFSAVYPKHWRLQKDEMRAAAKPSPASLDAQLWSAGQWAVAKATLELTQHRAKDASKPWPEFTEYSCFNCHHDLRANSWRQSEASIAARKADGERIGSLVWQPWNLAFVHEVAAEREPLQSTIKQLRISMGSGGQDRANADRLAQQALWQLGNSDDRLYTQKLIDSSLSNIVNSHAEERDWERAAQAYLATMALSAGRNDPENPTLRLQLREAGKQLSFPKDSDSPGGDVATAVKQLRELFGKIR